MIHQAIQNACEQGRGQTRFKTMSIYIVNGVRYNRTRVCNLDLPISFGSHTHNILFAKIGASIGTHKHEIGRSPRTAFATNTPSSPIKLKDTVPPTTEPVCTNYCSSCRVDSSHLWVKIRWYKRMIFKRKPCKSKESGNYIQYIPRLYVYYFHVILVRVVHGAWKITTLFLPDQTMPVLTGGSF